jgi:hypothetical protein
MSLNDSTREQFLEAFSEATKPIYAALDRNQQAIDQHALDATRHNSYQDSALDRLLSDNKSMHENQLQYHLNITAINTTLVNIDKKLDSQDAKLDHHNIMTGEIRGTVKSLGNQNKEQFERIVELEKGSAIIDKVKDLVPTSLLSGFFNNKVVQVGLVMIMIIVVYGAFKAIGVDVGGAKQFIVPMTGGS